MVPGDGSLSAWRILLGFAGVVLATIAAVSCSQNTRYRVLTFLLDGVPEPGAVVQEGYPLPTGTGSTEEGEEQEKRPARPVRVIKPHPPYRNNECRSCHNISTGRLVKETDAGLCVLCHAAPSSGARYLHGPVVVDACGECHHYHGTTLEHMLLTEQPELCFYCHKRSDLTGGAHHETVDEEACTECHDPHGGDNRFFLKRRVD